MRLIDADALPRHGNRGGLVHWKDIENAPTIDITDTEACRKCQEATDRVLLNKWIPCSERLPQENGRYLVTRGLNACGVLWNRVYVIAYSDLMGLNKEKIWWNGNIGKSDFEKYDDVLSWKPLPDPYMEVEE